MWPVMEIATLTILAKAIAEKLQVDAAEPTSGTGTLLRTQLSAGQLHSITVKAVTVTVWEVEVMYVEVAATSAAAAAARPCLAAAAVMKAATRITATPPAVALVWQSEQLRRWVQMQAQRQLHG